MYRRYIETMQLLKSQGVTREEVLDVLEFDSDEYPDQTDLETARDEVYGIPLVTPKVFAEVIDAIVSNAARDRRQAGLK